MKMVLQYQRSVNLLSNGTYSGDATYLTELLFEQTDYKDATAEVKNTLDGTATITKLSMTVDGNSGKWGCDFHYKDAAAPLPLAFGVDDSPEAIYDYYIDYAHSYCEKLNVEKDDNGKFKYDEITKILDISELEEGLELTVVYNETDKDKVYRPYPTRI